MQKIISCDWGTSALRLRVVDVDTGAILAKAINDRGIVVVYSAWKKSGKPESERVSFYQSILTAQIAEMEKQLGISLLDMPLIISGMASSTIGMMELPYAITPFGVDGHELYVHTTHATGNFRHAMLVVSGVKGDNDDVLRGEETQLIGCLNEEEKEVRLFIFPGTHSKHIVIKNGEAANLATFMTGEFFELLSQKSILSIAVEEGGSLSEENNLESFEQGVKDGSQMNLLHGAFRVRTNDLFHSLSKQQNYFYLSGLLIGTELKEVMAFNLPVTIVSDASMTKLYSTALQKLGMPAAKYHDAGKAVVAGHCKLYNLYKAGLNAG